MASMIRDRQEAAGGAPERSGADCGGSSAGGGAAVDAGYAAAVHLVALLSILNGVVGGHPVCLPHAEGSHLVGLNALPPSSAKFGPQVLGMVEGSACGRAGVEKGEG